MTTTEPLLGTRFDEALVYASRIHRSQTRTGSGIPYVSHLLGVCAIAIENGGDEDQAIAALLHDAVEDQGGTERLADIRVHFGEAVAAIVADCTDSDVEPKPPWRERKEAYLASLAHKPRASLEVSLADKTHNASAIVADLAAHGDALWDRFSAKRDGCLWYYRALADAFSRHLPSAGSARLARLVADMERIG